MGVLEEIRVLELGEGVASAFAARLIGDHGADVIKVETPEGDVTRRRGPFPDGVLDLERSGLFLALNANKRGLCLDLDAPEGRAQLERLIDSADLLIHSHSRQRAEALGLDDTSLRSRRPQLVTLSMTPFGSSGPYADYRGEELTISNGGGWATLCPAATGRPDLPPLKPFGQQCGFMSGVAGAAAALASYFSARRTGIGENIDFSSQAYTSSVLENAVPAYSYTELIATRYGYRFLIPWRIFECRDGAVFLVCVEPDQWERMVELMGRPDWTELEVFATQAARAENHDLVHEFVQQWMAEQNVDELYHEAQSRRICLAPVMSLQQMDECEHLAARGFFVESEHPRAGRLRYPGHAGLRNGERLGFRRPAPTLGEHSGQGFRARPELEASGSGQARLPLDGIRVADLSWAWAGPFCAMNLAHLGAEVIRFESAGRPDLYRRLPVHPPGVERTLNTCGMFNQWNQGKKSVGLNLAEPRAIDLLKDFLLHCDVVVENFATGVMQRLGLSYEGLAELNPGLVMASISGYGQTGPYRNYMGYGPAVPALTGLMATTGFVGGGPSEVGVSMPDPTAGITATFEICAALLQRQETGRGAHLDISLWEATAAFSVEAWMDYAMNGVQPERLGNRDPWMSPHGCFPCQGEDRWISIACASEADWQALCAVLDPALLEDARFRSFGERKSHEDALEERLSELTRARDRWELTRALQARGLPAFPSFTARDIVEDPHYEARGFIERLPHPEVGRRALTGIPYRLSRRPNGVRRAAPILGADTDAVLSEVLGYSGETIEELRRQKVLC